MLDGPPDRGPRTDAVDAAERHLACFLIGPEPVGDRREPDIGIDTPQVLRSGMNLELADVTVEVALCRDVGLVDRIEVNELQVACAHRRELDGHLATDGAHADDRDVQLLKCVEWDEVVLSGESIHCSLCVEG